MMMHCSASKGRRRCNGLRRCRGRRARRTPTPASVSRHEMCTAPRISHLTPHTSHLTPHTSHLTPHTSHLTPHTSHLTPHTSHLAPHTSHITHLPGQSIRRQHSVDAGKQRRRLSQGCAAAQVEQGGVVLSNGTGAGDVQQSLLQMNHLFCLVRSDVDFLCCR